MAMWCLELAKLRTPLPAGGTRRDRQIAEQSPGELGRGLAEVAGFAHLGEPSSRDGGCARISAWDQWPGPENALGEAFAEASRQARCAQRGSAQAPSARRSRTSPRPSMAICHARSGTSCSAALSRSPSTYPTE